MSNILTVSRLVVVVSLVGCVPPSVGFSGASSTPFPSGGYGGYASEPAPAPSSVEVDNAYGPGEDRHWFSHDDYLVADEPYKGALIRGLVVAKMVQAPGGGTQAEAKFVVANGTVQWSAHYVQTRIATRADLVVGAPAMCRTSWDPNAVTPKSKHDARQNDWLIAPITDNADLYKGRVTVGPASCEVGGVRVPI